MSETSLVERDPATPRPGLHAMLGLTTPLRCVDVGANPIDEAAPYSPRLAAGWTQVVGRRGRFAFSFAAAAVSRYRPGS